MPRQFVLCNFYDAVMNAKNYDEFGKAIMTSFQRKKLTRNLYFVMYFVTSSSHGTNYDENYDNYDGIRAFFHSKL
jgi:hypothetical protein